MVRLDLGLRVSFTLAICCPSTGYTSYMMTVTTTITLPWHLSLSLCPAPSFSPPSPPSLSCLSQTHLTERAENPSTTTVVASKAAAADALIFMAIQLCRLSIVCSSCLFHKKSRTALCTALHRTALHCSVLRYRAGFNSHFLLLSFSLVAMRLVARPGSVPAARCALPAAADQPCPLQPANNNNTIDHPHCDGDSLHRAVCCAARSIARCWVQLGSSQMPTLSVGKLFSAIRLHLRHSDVIKRTMLQLQIHSPYNRLYGTDPMWEWFERNTIQYNVTYCTTYM